MKQRPLLILSAIMMGIFLASIDALVVGTAMPTIIRELGGLRLYSWVFNAYILASALTMPVFGKLSDMYPKQHIFAACVGIFLIGSVLCGSSQSILQLVVFRGIQGLGAGGMFTVPFAILGTVFGPKERGRMIGYTSTVWGISSILGPLLGSIIVMQFNWRWVFYVNVPFGIAAVMLIMLVYREAITRRPAGLDYSGTGLLGTAIILILLSFLNLSRGSHISPLHILSLATGVGILYFFYITERRATDPILAVKILSEPEFLFPNLCAFMSGAVIFSAIAFIPFFVQTVTQGSAIQAGGVLMPIAFSWSGTSIILGHFFGNVHVRVPVAAGFIMIGAGLSGFLLSGPGSLFWMFMASGVGIGIGAGLITPTLLVAVQNCSNHGEIGSITSAQHLFNRIGGVMGIGITGAAFSLLFFHYSGNNPELSQILSGGRTSVGVAGSAGISGETMLYFIRSLKGAFIIDICLACIGIILAFFIPGTRKEDTHADIPPEYVP